MKKRIIIVFILTVVFVLFTLSLFAQESSSTEINFDKPEDLASAIKNNPELAAQATPDQLVKAIQQDYSLVSKLKIGDLTRSINQEISLMQKSTVFEEVNSRAISNPSFLNEASNVKIKNRWWKAHGVEDEGGMINKFDGEKVTTSPGETTVTLTDVRGAVVLKDGTFKFKGIKIVGTKDFSLSGEPVFKMVDGKLVREIPKNAVYEMKGGILKTPLDSEEAKGLRVHVQNGVVNAKSVQTPIRFEDPSNPKVIIEGSLVNKPILRYSGSDFDFFVDDNGNQQFSSKTGPITRQHTYSKKWTVSPLETEPWKKMEITGTIEDPQDSRLGEFILKGNTNLAFDGGILKTEGAKQIYYTEERDNPLSFCKSYSCVINTPSILTENYRKELQFLNIQDVKDVEFKSSVYYGNVGIENLQSGKINFISLDKQGNEISRIITESHKPAKGQGKLAKTNIGRFDNYYEKDGENLLNHLSTTENLKKEVADYFKRNPDGSERKYDTFVTCKITECENVLAKSKGKQIGPSPAKIFGICAGDNCETLRSIENTCNLSLTVC